MCPRRPRLALAVLLLAGALPARADVRDWVSPHHVPDRTTCPGGCAPWTQVSPGDPAEQARIDSFWSDPAAQRNAGSRCAMPAASAGYDLGDGRYIDHIFNSLAGAWCYCAEPVDTSPRLQYCVPDPARPAAVEQLNLQVAAPDVVVASFVTRDTLRTAQTSPPVGQIGRGRANAENNPVAGISHFYPALSTAEGGNYTLHFVKFGGLVPGETYTYRVRSGNEGARQEWSPWHKFRAPAVQGPTRIGIYGDMGHSLHNPMHNLLDYCHRGEIDTIVHMGDHAYDLGGCGDRRGDAYMDVFSPTLSECPWVPVIGNHEVNDGDNFQRYLNMTWGETEKDDGGDDPVFHSTADSRLGELLTRTTLLGPGIHSGRSAGSGSGVPSNTSRYFSVNIGRVHLCGLDLNSGHFDANQTAWLEADLASVDRDTTPWVVLTSHFPLVHPSMFQSGNFSAAYYRGEDSENFATSGHAFKRVACEAETGVCAEETVRGQQQALQASLVTIMDYYHVDLYIAGHIHDYATMWPQCYDELTGAISVCKDAQGKVIQSFDQPPGTVHITEGNGGVPGCNGTVAPDNASINPDATFNCGDVESCRTWFTGCAHGRLVAVDAGTMTYEHVSNKDGKVYDSLTITKTHSAPFRTHGQEG